MVQEVLAVRAARVSLAALAGLLIAAGGTVGVVPFGTDFDIAGNGTVSVGQFIGDVGKPSGSTTLTVQNDAVTNAKLANMATGMVKCRTTAGTGDPEDCTTLPTAATAAITGDVAKSAGSNAATVVAFNGNAQVAKADGGTGSTNGRGAANVLSLSYVLCQSGAAPSHTGDTTETVLATCQIPANALGLNGCADVWQLWQWTNSANNKTPRVRLGGAAGTIFYNPTATTSATAHALTRICNANAANSQVSPGNTQLSNGATAAIVTGALDTTSAQDLVISGQLANSGETISLIHYRVVLTTSAGN
jgi:hypothetical protein